jgi:S-disulfanyl-L-cysteine oxidoreductase SoxD
MRRLQICLLCLPACVAAASRSVWDGAYTREQSARGKAAYLEVCAKCHGETLSGGEGAPPLVGKDFLKNWNGRTAGELLGVIIKTMPTDDPGSLSRRQYADLTAFVLNENEFPAGAKDLDSSPDASKDIRIEEKK